MPSKSKHPCPGPGCLNFTYNRYCDSEQCRRFFNKQLHQRCTQNEKVDDDFYDTEAWRLLRKQHLTQYPECTRCSTMRNLTVDHKVPISQGGGKLDPNNLQTLCNDCHRRKTRLEDGWSSSTSLTVVCGPPASGKSTYVEQHANPWDVVIDRDLICKAAFPKLDPHSHLPAHAERYIESAITGILERLERGKDKVRAWYVLPSPARTERDVLRNRFNAKVLVIEAPTVVCMQRINNDARNPDVDWHTRISTWQSNYEKDPLDIIIETTGKPDRLSVSGD